MKKVLWVTSWDRRCGIADYSKALFDSVRQELQKSDVELKLASLDEYRNPFELLSFIRSENPGLVHFQHEYGLFGGKNPPKYWFPEVVDVLKRDFRTVKISATAHTVLDPAYSFPVSHTGIQAPARFLANAFLLPVLRGVWGERTWGMLDGVVCHSRHQVASLQAAGVKHVEVIPHFVFNEKLASIPSEKWETGEKITHSYTPYTLVFGFISPDKGQDLALEALIQLKNQGQTPHLVFAGGSRRKEDEAYYERILTRAKSAGVLENLTVTGYVPSTWFDILFQKAELVIAPFRTTSGSGSLAQAFARGAPVLTSDLSLNTELAERVSGVLEFFKTGNSEDLAQKWKDLLGNKNVLRSLSEKSRLYAQKYSIAETAKHSAEWMKSFL